MALSHPNSVIEMSFDDYNSGSDYVRMGNDRRNPPSRPSPHFGGAGNSRDTSSPEQISANIQQIANNNASISRLSSFIGSPKDDQELRDKIAVQTEKTKKIIMETTDMIKRLSNTKGTGSEAQQLKIQQQKLAKDFRVVAERFQEVTKESARKERSNKVQSPKAEANRSAPYLTEEQEERQSLLRQQAEERKQALVFENDISHNEAIIREREEGIRELERAVLEVNEIYKDLAVLVQEQGETLDLIENNISGSAAKTEQAISELKAASESQKSSRLKMCILACIIIVVVIVIVIVMNL